jgi:hypothetical protein
MSYWLRASLQARTLAQSSWQRDYKMAITALPLAVATPSVAVTRTS